MRAVLYIVAQAVAVLFASMLIPLLVVLGSGEADSAPELAMIATIGLAITIIALMAVRVRLAPLNRPGTLLTVVLLWLVLPLPGALPFFIGTELGLIQSIFEAYSGLTTTGASSFAVGMDLALPYLFWRVQLEWIGGLLTLVSVLFILAPAGIGGLPTGPTSPAGSVMTIEREQFDLDRFWRLLSFYVTATIIVAIALVLAGVEPFIGLLFAMSAISTGGFVPIAGPLEVPLGGLGMFIVAITLAASATSFLWQNASGQKIRRTAGGGGVREAQIVGLLILVLMVVYAWRLRISAPMEDGLGVLSLLGEAFFVAASLVSTSGLEPRFGVIALLPGAAVLGIVFLGGGIFTTAGGIKIYRLGGLMLQSWRELTLLVHPSSIAPGRLLGVSYDETMQRSLWTVFIIAVLTVALGTFLLSLDELGFEAGFAASVALFSNAGPVYEALTPQVTEPGLWLGFSQMHGFSLFVATAIMILGRLEVLVVLSVFNLRYWLSR